MRFNKYFYFYILIVFVVLISVTGCSAKSNEGVVFKAEQDLQKNGFLQYINKEVDLGESKILFTKVVFDIDSMTFAYKGKILLPEHVINIKSNSALIKRRNLGPFEYKPVGPGVTTYPGYNIVTVPHNLELIKQRVPVEININGVSNQFSVNFPGDKIASMTAEKQIDNKGFEVSDNQKAIVRVLVGVNFTKIERRGFGDFTVFDVNGKKALDRGFSVSTSGDTIELFDPLSIPRNKVSIRILPEENTVLLKR